MPLEACTFAQAGYRGVGIDIKKPQRLETDEELSRCLFLEADLTDEIRLEEACKEACKWLGGRLDVLINNAGLTTGSLMPGGKILYDL